MSSPDTPADASSELRDGWEVVGTAPGAELASEQLDRLDWLPARVPGTVAGALHDAGRAAVEASALDERDWWFRVRFAAEPVAAGEEVTLELDGLATVCDVQLNGVAILASESMFAGHALDVGTLLRDGTNELRIRCRALGPLLRERRRPRARWRTRLADGNLRFFRTTLLGRAPGFAPGPPAIGPWRGVRLRRRRRVAVDGVVLRTRLDGSDGVLSVDVRLRPLDVDAPREAAVVLVGPSGSHRVALSTAPLDGAGRWRGELRVPAVARWWPHTHGDPVLHDVRLVVAGAAPLELPLGRVGFRTLAAGAKPGHDVERDGLDLHVNGVRLFARGAVWTPVDAVGLAPTAEELRAAVRQARDAGMNMLRIAGIGMPESAAFHDLCDELGLLLWQDFPFANFDYPISDPAFRAAVEQEAAALLAGLAGRPSLAVLCGNSEIEQQVAMLGLDPALGRGELFGELLPAAVATSGADAVWVPSAPSGGALPFRADHGVANWFGVGGYRRPLEDARRAGVRFASECLAFANVPDEAIVAELGTAVVHDPRWKAGVPRDAGSGWDFEDVRDHYLAALFAVEPTALRSVDPERYLELSRAVTGEAMAEVLGEWRRGGSPCGGALILWLRDLVPGAGWGLVDHRGGAKVAYHHVRRALAPLAVWTTDEGLGGIAVHVANDGPAPRSVALRVALYRDGEQRVEEERRVLELAPHETIEHDVEALLGRFVDAAWAYRFGPPAHDVVVASLESPAALDGGDDERPALLAQAFRFPADRPLIAEPPARLGLEAEVVTAADGVVELLLRSRRVAYGVRLHAPGWDAADDAFSVEPGGTRRVRLSPREPGATLAGAAVTALNLSGRVGIVRAEGVA